ncbi:MAG: AraC family transcriptional regulator [Pseudonocardiales bacterium]|nr:MAG: AraC family transcriptional regulator [Pseudonocardiales bacterium]
MAPRTSFNRHTHDDHQLAWAASGVLTVFADDRTWLLPPSRALWIPAGVPHEVLAVGSATMLALYVRSQACAINWPQPQCVMVGPLLGALMQHLAQVELDPQHRARAEAVLVDSLVPVDTVTIEAAMPRDDRASAVAQALVDNPADQRSLDEWGRHVGASARTLARAFSADTGVSFGRWRTSVRLRAALTYLAEGLPVGNVARRVGYDTPSAFVAAFRRETGLTPGAYFHTSIAERAQG